MKTPLTIVLTSLCTVTASYAGPLAEAPLSVVSFVPSNVIFPLSVEFPTAVTAAYKGTSGYTSASEYLGIFNPDKCYTYDTANNWFAPSTMATNRTCSNAWSGNFLNWATMTGLDEFRVAMTGGNRYVDTTQRTVLERTYMSNQGSTGSNFPDRTPPWSSSIVGAVPTAYESLTRIANLNKGVRMTVTNGGNNTDFYVRAVVCDPSIGGVDNLVKEHCTAYGTAPNYIYKPTGKVQKYGERMRFGVFSYFNSTSIDNAVMRSKSKFVAPKKWTASGSTTNSNREWDEATGILVTNPDPTEASASFGGAVSNSGVINYINKFGASAQSYKTYDNFGKLWYEALRYLQGLTPTPDFYAKATLANGDGFPIITSWDDPVQYYCQKNFLMGMGDTHTWCDKRLPGAEFTGYVNNQCRLITGTNGQLADQGSLNSDSGVDVSEWTDKIDAKESAVSNMSTSSIQNGASYNMAGLSYWAAYHGIRSMNNLTSHTPSTNPAENIKVKSFIIDVLESNDLGINQQFWFATKYGGADSFDTSGNPVNWSVKRTFSSPYPTFNNGDWPKTLLPAGDPASMMAAVDAALATIDADSGTATSSAPSSGNLATQSGTGVNAYSTSFDPKSWVGDVESKVINVTDLSVSAAPAWKASAKLPAWDSRKILTFNDGLNVDGTETAATDARDGVAFSWDNLSPRQKAFLNRNPADGDTADTKGSARLDYIRGDGSNEGASGEKWRARTSRLGDFVNSAPVLVKTPSNLKDTDYTTYKSAVANRIPMLYVGGNDGMLHAFNAEANANGTAKTNSGKEVFAYVPSAVYSKLNKLPWNDYGHLYYVDATPVVADAKIDTGCTTASDTYKCWRTVLVGGLGAGGQGVYALNVTNPANFGSASASDIVMWEFTDRDDADLGYTFSRPFVRKMNNGKWAVIFGNGYNSKADDNDVGTVERKGSGRAFLYVVYLDGPTGSNRTWVKDTDYFKIELKSPDESATTPEQNGLSSVNGVDANNDGKIDYLYAGDRRGNLWKIDVSSATPSSWGAAYGSAAAPKPLFVAKTGDGTPVLQQVTTTPLIGRHPKGGYLILFGTGSYVEQSDVVSPFSTNSFYGIWDQNDGAMSGVVPIARGKLQKQKTLAINTDYTLLSNCKPQYDSAAQAPASASSTCPSSLQPSANGAGKVDQQFGWVLDLNYQMSNTPTGERYISNALPTLESDVLTFKTLTTSGDPCDGNGKDHLYNVDYRTGGAYAAPVFIELSGTTATSLYVNFGGSLGLLAPSGKVLTTHTGQNPSFIKFTANKGDGTPGTDTIASKVTFGGCTVSSFVPGRPCLKDVFNYDMDSQTRVRSAPWGTVGWRQLP